MKTAQIICAIILIILWGILLEHARTKQTTIRTPHRLTPRLELIIDSGRVDTVFIYKAERT